MPQPIIEVKNLSKQYKIGVDTTYKTLTESVTNTIRHPFKTIKNYNKQNEVFWALKDINFTVNRGEVVGIIGRNGAGKSTLLKVLSRITHPTEGEITLRGRVGSLLEVGTGFHPELTGRENIYFNGAILGMKKREIDAKFDEIVKFAEIEKFLDTPVKRYSSGMYVRLAFAVAAHMDPEILLVDEVLAVGDVAFQKKCLGKMGEVAEGGRTVLFVSHNMGAVSSLCNRTIYLVNGQIRASGVTDQIVAEYFSEVFQNRIQNLEQLRLPGYGKELSFCDIKLISSSDGQSLMFRQPIKYALIIKSYVDMIDLSIGSSIFNTAGTCIGTLFTEEKFSIRANQQLTLCLTISNLNLAPDSYYAGFSVGTGGGKTTRNDLDIVIGKPAFQVLPISEGKNPLANWSSGWGNIVIEDVKVTIVKRGET